MSYIRNKESRYQTKGVIEFLFRQFMTLRYIFDNPPKQWPTGKDRNTKN